VKFSDLAGKEIISIDKGERLGIVKDSDLIIDSRTGKLKAIVLPDYRRAGWLGRRIGLTIPWEGIKKIGVDLIIVDLRIAESPS